MRLSRNHHHQVVTYSSDLTDAQWNVLDPRLLVSSNEDQSTNDLRCVANAMPYVSHTGCQWRYRPE